MNTVYFQLFLGGINFMFVLMNVEAHNIYLAILNAFTSGWCFALAFIKYWMIKHPTEVWAE